MARCSYGRTSDGSSASALQQANSEDCENSEDQGGGFATMSGEPLDQNSEDYENCEDQDGRFTDHKRNALRNQF